MRPIKNQTALISLNSLNRSGTWLKSFYYHYIIKFKDTLLCVFIEYPILMTSGIGRSQYMHNLTVNFLLMYWNIFTALLIPSQIVIELLYSTKRIYSPGQMHFNTNPVSCRHIYSTIETCRTEIKSLTMVSVGQKDLITVTWNLSGMKGSLCQQI